MRTIMFAAALLGASALTAVDDTLDPYGPEAIERERGRYRQAGV